VRVPFPSTRLPFAASLWLAARLLPLYAARGSLEDLLAGATPQPGRRDYAEIDPAVIIAAVKRQGKGPWLMRNRRCLREGLLAFHYLALAGHAPRLHFGVVAASLRDVRPRAHCWLTLDGQPTMNPPQEPMVALFAYDGKAMDPAAGHVAPLEFRHA